MEHLVLSLMLIAFSVMADNKLDRYDNEVVFDGDQVCLIEEEGKQIIKKEC